MGPGTSVFAVLAISVSQLVASTSNDVTYVRDSQFQPSRTYLDRSAGEADGQRELDITLTGHKYCNNYRNIQGHEGSHKPGFTLRQVHIILSPAQINPSMETKEQPFHKPDSPCQILPKPEDSQKIHTFAEAARTYATVQDNKHGFKQFHPVSSPLCIGSYLTSTGFKQSISIGEHLSQSYFENIKVKLKPDNDNIQAESITEQSPYHSLLAFLYGFLPEKIFAKTKVHKFSGNFCNFDKQSNLSCHCRTANHLHKPVWLSILRGRYLYKDGYPGTDLINSIFSGISTQNLSPMDLYQALLHHTCDNLNIVCDKNSNCLNMSDIDHIQPIHQFVSSFLQTVTHDPTFQLFSQLYTFPFLHGLVSKIDRQDRTDRIHVHSGDRFFLQVLLGSLGIRLDGPIPVASRLVVEVYQKNLDQLDGGLFFFNLLYNGEDTTRQLTFCEGQLEEGLCSLQRLRDKVMDLQRIYQEKC